MKISFVSKAAFLLAQALTLCGSLQAETQVIKEEVQQVGDLLTSIDYVRDSRRRKCPERRHPVKKETSKEKEQPKEKDCQEKPIVKEHKEHKEHKESTRDPSLQSLYAFNQQSDDLATSVAIPANTTVGDDVPFNNGGSDPLVNGKAVTQLDDTDFLIHQDGDYLITFYAYNADPGFTTAGIGVQLFVRSVATGPADISNGTGDILSFSQIIRVTGTKSSPALVEVKAVASSTLGVGRTLDLLSGLSDGINATLEIVKLSD